MFKDEPGLPPELAFLGCRTLWGVMETLSNAMGLWLHVTMETDNGLPMASDLVVASVCALRYCAGATYNPAEGSPRGGPSFCLIVPGGRRKIVSQRKRKRRKGTENKIKQKHMNKSFWKSPKCVFAFLGPCVLCCICSRISSWGFYLDIITFS